MFKHQAFPGDAVPASTRSSNVPMAFCQSKAYLWILHHEVLEDSVLKRIFQERVQGVVVPWAAGGGYTGIQ